MLSIYLSQEKSRVEDKVHENREKYETLKEVIGMLEEF